MEKVDLKKEVEIRKRPLMRKLVRFIDTIWSKYRYNQICSEREIKNELRRLGIVDDLSMRMAMNVLYQTGILKSVLMFYEDKLGRRHIIQKRFYIINKYAHAIDAIKSEYPITLTPKRYTVKKLVHYFN